MTKVTLNKPSLIEPLAQFQLTLVRIMTQVFTYNDHIAKKMETSFFYMLKIIYDMFCAEINFYFFAHI